MLEDIDLTKIKAIGEVIQKNLAIVQQALGIEVANDDDLSELEIESEGFAKETISNFPIRRLTASELAEEKCYVFAMREANIARFLENQAMFAESVTKFNSSKDRFVQRQKVRHR
ncbi:hypothetical protein H6G17_04915 [Chroococcidiopsis sp. FACHB-1243]|uniref:hypothetical protein n=1 Tax=Chroococcidiopsis sp. [FACHB-1243] TaxID=2692781 RepID=UPI00177BAF34|nr:hypothetical protein [Chroococcidiopsis sp. [FACHB-1243]]MBD2304853.1 hypothetical protein [Chroococcidiopsis sp. [FACHB-1243]]